MHNFFKKNFWILLFLSLFLISCKNSSKNFKEVQFKDLKGPPLVIGILSQDSPKNVLDTFYPLKAFLENKLQKPIRIYIFKNFDKYYQKIQGKEIDILILDPASYCEIRWKTQKYIIPLVKPEGGEGEIRSVFVAKEGGSIEKIFDAINKRLALGDERSSFSYLIPVSMLKDVGLSLKDFKRVDRIENEHNIALFVLIGEYEVGALSESVANKYLKDGLKIIKRSEITPKFIVATRVDFQEKDKIKKLLLNQVDKKILQIFNIKSFAPAEDRDFDYIRVLIRNFKGKDYIEYSKDTIKVAILPLYSPLTIYKKFDPLMRYLSKKTGYEFKLVIPKDFEEFIKIVSEGKVHFSYQNPYVYALIAKKYPLKVLVITVGEECEVNNVKKVCGGKAFRGVIIVRKDSSIGSVKDLRGKKIFIVSPYSAGGFLSQRLFLEKKGFNVYKDFRLVDAKRQEKVIIGVYRKEADAGFVREAALSVFSQEVDMTKIKVLAFTEYLPNWPFCAVNVDPKLAKKVKDLLIHLKNKEVLKKANIKGFGLASD
ncbi:MAG TPA: phosphate/phosphite/phosphonate ABC transporter substrate-binding protein, partial [Thermodesulfobacterium geofontis]|nr:phosphate/phosphite/phosphonate ABC transporter substrate-binding protein [Thermodesulfobacterium geofontis]